MISDYLAGRALREWQKQLSRNIGAGQSAGPSSTTPLKPDDSAEWRRIHHADLDYFKRHYRKYDRITLVTAIFGVILVGLCIMINAWRLQ